MAAMLPNPAKATRAIHCISYDKVKPVIIDGKVIPANLVEQPQPSHLASFYIVLSPGVMYLSSKPRRVEKDEVMKYSLMLTDAVKDGFTYNKTRANFILVWKGEQYPAGGITIDRTTGNFAYTIESEEGKMHTTLGACIPTEVTINNVDEEPEYKKGVNHVNYLIKPNP